VADLGRALDDADWQVRREATIVLGRIDGREASQALVRALGDEAWQVVKEAAAGVGQQRVAAVEPLMRLLSHAHSDIRKNAAVALGAIAALEAVGSLTALAHDDDVEVRKAASRALNDIAMAGRVVHSPGT